MSRSTDWAPCVHNDEDKALARKWIHEVLDQSDQFVPLQDGDDCLDDDRLFSLADRVLHEIASLPVSPELGFASDQWIGVQARAVVDGIEYKTWVEADYFFLALIKTYELWKTGAYKETGEPVPNPLDWCDKMQTAPEPTPKSTLLSNRSLWLWRVPYYVEGVLHYGPEAATPSEAIRAAMNEREGAK